MSKAANPANKDKIYECISCGYTTNIRPETTIRCPMCDYKGMRLIDTTDLSYEHKASQKATPATPVDNNLREILESISVGKFRGEEYYLDDELITEILALITHSNNAARIDELRIVHQNSRQPNNDTYAVNQAVYRLHDLQATDLSSEHDAERKV